MMESGSALSDEGSEPKGFSKDFPATFAALCSSIIRQVDSYKPDNPALSVSGHSWQTETLLGALREQFPEQFMATFLNLQVTGPVQLLLSEDFLISLLHPIVHAQNYVDRDLFAMAMADPVDRKAVALFVYNRNFRQEGCMLASMDLEPVSQLIQIDSNYICEVREGLDTDINPLVAGELYQAEELLLSEVTVALGPLSSQNFSIVQRPPDPVTEQLFLDSLVRVCKLRRDQARFNYAVSTMSRIFYGGSTEKVEERLERTLEGFGNQISVATSCFTRLLWCVKDLGKEAEKTVEPKRGTATDIVARALRTIGVLAIAKTTSKNVRQLCSSLITEPFSQPFVFVIPDAGELGGSYLFELARETARLKFPVNACPEVVIITTGVKPTDYEVYNAGETTLPTEVDPAFRFQLWASVAKNPRILTISSANWPGQYSDSQRATKQSMDIGYAAAKICSDMELSPRAILGYGPRSNSLHLAVRKQPKLNGAGLVHVPTDPFAESGQKTDGVIPGLNSQEAQEDGNCFDCVEKLAAFSVSVIDRLNCRREFHYLTSPGISATQVQRFLHREFRGETFNDAKLDIQKKYLKKSNVDPSLPLLVFGEVDLSTDTGRSLLAAMDEFMASNGTQVSIIVGLSLPIPSSSSTLCTELTSRHENLYVGPLPTEKAVFYLGADFGFVSSDGTQFQRSHQEYFFHGTPVIAFSGTFGSLFDSVRDFMTSVQGNCIALRSLAKEDIHASLLGCIDIYANANQYAILRSNALGSFVNLRSCAVELLEYLVDINHRVICPEVTREIEPS